MFEQLDQPITVQCGAGVFRVYTVADWWSATWQAIVWSMGFVTRNACPECGCSAQDCLYCARGH